MEQIPHEDYQDEVRDLTEQYIMGDITADDILKIIAEKNDPKFKDIFIEELEFDIDTNREMRKNAADSPEILVGESADIEEAARKANTESFDAYVSLRDKINKLMM